MGMSGMWVIDCVMEVAGWIRAIACAVVVAGCRLAGMPDCALEIASEDRSL